MALQKIPFYKAHALAYAEDISERVVVYVSRQSTELLFMDSIYRSGGPFFPSGETQKAEGESVDLAALRILKEETDLSIDECHYLSSFCIDKPEVWHYYWCKAPPDTEDTWFWYSESLGAEFDCLFLPLSQYQSKISTDYPYAAALPDYIKLTQ